MTLVPEFGLLPFYLSEVLSYAAWTGAGYLAWRVVRAYERRCLEATRSRSLGRRVRRLEASMGSLERRVAWTAEAQQFTTTLLLGPQKSSAERSGSPLSRANSEPPVT
jgi:hypothetical protein